ncbi:MAG: FHA domain-containing protein [Microcystaceae cyanobacterium]
MSVTTLQLKVINTEIAEFQDQQIDLEIGQDCLIGRHPSCTLVLNSPEISRIHGKIWGQEGKCFFSDLGSTDGSKLNGCEVEINQPLPLTPDDLLRIGDYIIILTDVSSSLSSSLPTLQNTWTEGELTLRCLQVIEETHDVKTFRLIANPPTSFSYQPGQFITLNLNINDSKVFRSYSISSSPSRPHILEITVKRVPAPSDQPDALPGLVSNWLHDNIQVGSEITANVPMGHFTCGENPAKKLLFVSAGSGITPMMSMSRWLCDTGADVDIVFLHSAKTPQDIIYRHELESMATRYPHFKLALTLTRSVSGEVWQGYQGRLNELLLQTIAPDFQQRTVYVCGSNGFMKGVKTLLTDLGFPSENYHEESFGGAKKRKTKATSEASQSDSTSKSEIVQFSPHQTPSNSDSTVLVFQNSGKEITCDQEDIILDVAEEEGISLQAGCRMGSCGICKLRLLEGEVTYEDEPQCEKGHFLPCIAKASGKVLIEA